MGFLDKLKSGARSTGKGIVAGSKKVRSAAKYTWNKTPVGPVLRFSGRKIKQGAQALGGKLKKGAAQYVYKRALMDCINKSGDLNELIAEIESLDPDSLTDTNRQIFIKLIGQKLQIDQELDAQLNIP